MPVEQVTMYRTSDGSLHDAEVDAVHRESMLDSVQAVKNLLPDVKINMDNYYHLTPDQVAQFHKAYVAVVKNFYGVDNRMMEALDIDVKHGLVGRMLCDSDSPIYSLYILIECIDDDGRLWEQPYYAINTPDNPVCLNEADDG